MKSAIKPVSTVQQKGTDWHVHPSNIQISLCFHTVLSESLMDTMCSQGHTFLRDKNLDSDQTVAVQSDLNLTCTHMPTWTLCLIPAHYCSSHIVKCFTCSLSILPYADLVLHIHHKLQ